MVVQLFDLKLKESAEIIFHLLKAIKIQFSFSFFHH